MKLSQIQFPSTQYVSEERPKNQIFLHHTAGNSDPFATYSFWATNPERIATCMVIGGKPGPGANFEDGEVVQGFNSNYWAFHLGLKESTFNRFGIPYKSLDRFSIAIEICNWGQLVLKGGKYYNYVNRQVPSSEVIELPQPFKGFKYFHNYTDAQIEALKALLVMLNQKYSIPLTYRDDVWDISTRALRGESGVFTHNSVRTDKVDIYPHPKLVQMWKSL